MLSNAVGPKSILCSDDRYDNVTLSPLVLHLGKRNEGYVIVSKEMIACFVDIAGIDDHHCLNFFS